MNSDMHRFSPPGPRRPVRRLPFPSPPLMRSLGTLGFMGGGLAALHLGAVFLGVEIDLFDEPNWNGKMVGLFVGSLLVALLCGLFCMAIGGGIEVKSESTNHVISVLWHYFANGSLIAMFLFMLVFSKLFGKEGTVAFVKEFGSWRFTLWTIGASACASTVVGGLLVGLRLLPRGARPRLGAGLLVALPVSMGATYLQFEALGLESRLWVFLGAALPVGLILVSAYMVRRDEVQRAQLLAMDR